MVDWDCEAKGHITPIGEDRCRVCGAEDIARCDVCDLRPAKGVGASPLGPVSLAYCVECLRHGAEATWLVEFTLSQCGSWANVREDIRELLHVWKPDGRGGGEYARAVEVYSDEDLARLMEAERARDRELEQGMRAAGEILGDE